MESEDYVLCYWKGDLWPAKVLSRAGTQTHSEGREGSLLDVQFLSMEKVQVRSTDVRPLTEAGIEAIASSAGLCLRANEFPDALCKDSGPPGQASAHTEALKVALEILSSRKLAGQGTPVESPQSEPEAPRAQPGPGPCTGKKPPKRKLNSEPNLGKRACLPSHHMCHAGSEHALPVSVAHTATAASAHEMQAQVSESSSVSSLVPTVKGAINPSQSEKTLGARAPKSSGHPSSWKCRYAKAQFPGLYMRPVVVLTRFKDQSQKGEDAGGEGIKVCDPHRFTISPKGMEDSAKSASQAGLPGAGASSVSPNSWIPHAVSTANRKRKCQPAGVNTGAKKCKVPKTSNEPKVTGTKKEGEEREETQSKSVAPRSKAPLIETGMLVWFYLRGYPFWPSVVQSVDQTKNTARVLLIEPNLLSEQRGIQVPLCKLKPLECRSKDLLVQRASQHYGLGVAWCLSLITYYQEVVASGNFKGSFLEYLSSNGHFLVAEAFEETELKVHFPVVKYPNQGDSEEKTFQDGKSTLGKGNFPGCVNGKMEKEKKEGTGEEQKIYEWEKSEKEEEKKEMEDMDKNWKEVIEEEREEEDKKDMVNELKEEEKVEKETQKEESMEEERREEEKDEKDKEAEEKELGEERLGKEKKQEQREKQEEKEEEQLKRQEFHDVDKDKIMEQKEIEEDKETAEMVEVKMEQKDNLETEENVGQKEEEKIEEVMLKKEDEEKEKEQVKEVEEAEEKMEEDEVEEEEEKEDAKSKTMLEKENDEEEDKKQEEEEEEEEKKEEDEEEKEEIKGEEKEEEEKEEETEEEKKEEEKDKEEKREKEEKEERMRYFRMILSDNYCKYTREAGPFLS